MTTKAKLVGLFIMTADDGSIPLNSKGQPYVLTSEPDAQFSGFVKFAETTITYELPTQAQIVEALRSKILADRATLVEESGTRIAALDSVINRLEKGTSA